MAKKAAIHVKKVISIVRRELLKNLKKSDFKKLEVTRSQLDTTSVVNATATILQAFSKMCLLSCSKRGLDIETDVSRV